MISKIELINHFTAKFEKCRYLEIGSLKQEIFKNVQAFIKHDVEPFPQSTNPTFLMTSDKFFSNEQYVLTGQYLIRRRYDVIFIDGLHLAEQVISDVYNAVQILSDNGFIIIHDCLPQKEAHQTRTQTDILWMGDVWKAQSWFVKNFPDKVCTIEDSDCGCGIINGKIHFISHFALNFTWSEFEKNKIQLLNLKSWNNYKNI